MTTNSNTKITKTGLGARTAIAGRAVLVTGANRGLGQALVEEALSRGAARVYAGARQPFTHPDERVTPVIMDVTKPGADPGSRRARRVARHPDQQRRPVASQ
jgi:NAD(P)-dependent dehydrogenase (short-subunit alcohol dehydrogenase family)